MKQLLTLIFSAFILFSAGAVQANDLDLARQGGQVGETRTGYIAAIGNADVATQTLIMEVNRKRKAHYQSISAQNGQPLDVVQKIAAEKIINGLPAGVHYQTEQGGWAKK
jgi:hypothetical protein